ncbi:CPBP family intramembrane glutamic endopeptidase [Serinicoccus kebangsaanensis]|uniref:CPBP family intramembrane glutamic endopeptidase n=1 Tax=Serinicoccus kebangsaanensis TaxID=2602069 RepID=UPI001EE17435|nr:type II CAAX endopeptidase family protein [Serinicoccus kebangsaanensis]
MSTQLPAPPSTLPRRSLLTETVLVLGVSLGASAVWSLLSLLRKLTAQGGLAGQTTSMNTSSAPDQPWLDLAYQLVGIALALVPVVLALHLLARELPRPWAALGLDRRQPLRDLVQGTMLAAVIGIPGLGLYLLARELGVNTSVAPANLPSVWWAVPVLVLAAAQNAVVEEVIAVGYLFTRWAQAGWSTWTIILTSALLRGSYHLYQGFGGFVGNVAMGVILGWFYTRTRRVMPLVVAHTLLDVVAFVGYAALAGRVGWL